MLFFVANNTEILFLRLQFRKISIQEGNLINFPKYTSKKKKKGIKIIIL